MKKPLAIGMFPQVKLNAYLWWIFGIIVATIQPLPAQVAGQIYGPDGNSYPDWRSAGVQNGTNPAGTIPVVTNVIATISTSNAASNLAGAIQSAANSATTNGLIVIPTGTWNLTQPVFISKSGIVISGGDSTSSDTIINFTWQPSTTNTPSFYQPPSGNTTIYANTWIQALTSPTNLSELQIYAISTGGTSKSICTMTVFGSPAFAVSTTGQHILDAFNVTSGTYKLEAISTYGTTTNTFTTSNYYTFTSSNAPITDTSNYPIPGPNANQNFAAFNFSGYGDYNGHIQTTTAKVNISQSAAQGTNTLAMPIGHGFTTGEQVELYSPTTSNFDMVTGNVCPNPDMREYQFTVATTTSNSITLNQPLRIPYNIEDTTNPPYVYPITTIQNCGVQNLTLNQTHGQWSSGFLFTWAWNCWVQNIVVNNTGRFPVWFAPSKWCEVNNCTFAGCWNLGPDGTGYVGFEKSYDDLMQNVTATGFRHGPLVQYSAAGNVLRNSTFTTCDPQWHAGWANNNLFEGDTVLASVDVGTPTNGGYGSTGWASPPNDPLHGPNGPYNVVYNCDFSGSGSSAQGPLTGIYMGGANNSWTYLWNRISVDSGFGFYAQMASGGHLVQSNLFVLGQTAAAVDLSDTNSTNSAFADNTFIGPFNPNGLFTGLAQPAINSGNSTNDTLQMVTFPNGTFTNGTNASTNDWNGSNDHGMSTATAAAADTELGLAYGLEVNDTTTTNGSSMYSSAFNVTPGFTYATRFFYQINSESSTNNSMGAYIYFYNSSNTLISSQGTSLLEPLHLWQPFMVAAEAPAGAATAKVYLHSYNGGTCNVYLDNFEFGVIPMTGDPQNAGIPFDSSFVASTTNGTWVGWNNSGDNGESQVIFDSTTSNQLLQVTDPGTGSGSSLSSSNFFVTTNDTYQVRFTANTVSGTGGAAVILRFYNGTTELTPAYQYNLPVDADPQQYAFRGVPPAGATSANLWIHCFSSATVTEDFDNFTILELPPQPVPSGDSVPSIYSWELNPVYLNQAQDNNGFETGDLTDWGTTYGGGDHGISTVTNTVAHSGTYSLYVDDTSTNEGASVMSQAFPATSNEVFQLSYYSYLKSGSGLGVYVYFLNSSGTILNTGIQPLQVPSTPLNAWTQETGNFTAPAGTVNAEIWIHSFNANTIQVYLDDFQLTQVLSPPP